MHLTLYRTRIAHVPAYAYVHDYTIRNRAKPVGRLYQVRGPAAPGLAWSWLITVDVDPRAEVRTSGTAADLAEAKEAFRTNLRKWLKWKRRENALSRMSCERTAKPRSRGRTAYNSPCNSRAATV
jgi:hypothetical protein